MIRPRPSWPSWPRRASITPGDQASLALDVTNTTDKVQEVKLLLSARKTRWPSATGPARSA